MRRLQARPTGITLAQFMKHSHPCKPPPPPSLKAPPPPPPGPPPSVSQTAARSQGNAAPVPEPRRNAWEQPLAGSRLSHALCQADALESPSNMGHDQSHTGADQHALSQQESRDAASSVNADGTMMNSYNAHPAFGVASSKQQRDKEGAATISSSHGQPECQSASGAAVPMLEPAHTSDQYPNEAQHNAQIADLQASAMAACLLAY